MKPENGVAPQSERVFIPPDLSALLAPPALIELLPVAAYACDAAGRLLWFNQRAADLWGRSPRIGDDTEVFCGSHKLFFDGRLTSREETPMAMTLRTGEAVHGAEGLLERPDGSTVWVTVHIEPVKDPAGNVLGAINCFHDTTELHQARAAAAEREAQTRHILEALPAAVYTTDEAGRVTYCNEAAVNLVGREPGLGSAEWCVSWKLFHPDGRPMPHEECPMAVALKEKRAVRGVEAIVERPDGSRVPFMPYPTPLFDGSGRLSGAVNMLVDISDRKEFEQRQQLLANELLHRIKNLLAVVQTIASRSLSGTRSMAEARDAFAERIQALGRSQALLVNGLFEGAQLADIIRMELEVFGDRVQAVGMDVMLNAKAAQTFAMVVHELATNAAKHGALSTAQGKVQISWSVVRQNGAGQFRFKWLERDGPPVVKPKRQGFGRILIEKAAAQEFSADPRLSFEAEGLAYEFEAPLAALAREADSAGV